MFGPEATRLDGAPGFPIRRPAGPRACAPHRGLSQLAASFVGFLCQGIRRLPLPSSFYLRRYGFTTHWAPPRGALGVILHEMRSSRRKSSLVTLCSSQGTARASPGDRTPRGQGPRRPGDWKGPEAWRLGLTGRPVAIIKSSLEEVCLPRKEVIQPHLPVRLPCYDFTPLTLHTFDASAPLRGSAGGFGCRRLGWCDGRCVQGPGTHSPRRADPRLLATPTSRGRVAAPGPNWGRL